MTRNRLKLNDDKTEELLCGPRARREQIGISAVQWKTPTRSALEPGPSKTRHLSCGTTTKWCNLPCSGVVACVPRRPTELCRREPCAPGRSNQAEQGPGQEDSSPEELMTQTGESPREASLPTHLLTTKTRTRIGTWNIRTLYESGKSAQVAREMRRYNITVLGLCETRWNGSGQTRLTSGETIIYSGHKDRDHDHTQGVALLMSTEATKALRAWEPVSPRLMSEDYHHPMPCTNKCRR
ncbi:hypothetical protein C0Q70_14465 [Pomacea canaliculata]|uniref:Endonuclease/exonuclease/phosphatase domain-containing protein n=1 Tax=Pomacea canaliculata TaxID=400727 RepID=A0A2T7P035_POMCA|nr:hypothetical protein C0Q70_14465 [Pomacea canaliculata]